MQIRTKWQTVKAGQAAPYADTIRQVRVLFEIDYQDGKMVWKVWKDIKEEAVRALLPYMNVGFTDYLYPPPDGDHSQEAYFRARLDYLREIEPGIWEFQTRSPYTD